MAAPDQIQSRSNEKLQQYHGVMDDYKRIPEKDHTEHEEPGPGDHPVCNGCHPRDQSNNTPFEKDVEQGVCDDGDHHRVHLETPVGKDQCRGEYIERTEREQPECGDTGRRVQISVEDPGPCR